MTTMAQLEPAVVTVGVDTHLELHVGVALDQLGRRLGQAQIPTTESGYDELVQWAEAFGEVEAFGVEGTGCYGAGLARHLRGRGSWWWRSSARTARLAVATEGPIP